MKNKKRKEELIYWLDYILAIKPVIYNLFGKDYFEREYMLLEKLRQKIYDIEMSDTDINRLKISSINLFKELNLSILNKKKIVSMLN